MSMESTLIGSYDIDNIVELPYYDKDRVVGYLRTQFHNERLCTWAGNVLLCTQPFKETVTPEARNPRHPAPPSVDALVDRVWFRLNHGIGKRDQVVVVSGDSGSGKTYSTCLAIKAIAQKQITDEESDSILRQAWASVPLLSAFGNASTQLNANSSRFGKLLRLQYIDGKLCGAMIETYLIEKSRVTNINQGEGNFHIFRQILESLDEDLLNSLYLSKGTRYRIAPKTMVNSTYPETIKSLETLNITELNEICTILSVILNLGNVAFQEESNTCHGDGFDIGTIKICPDSAKYISSVAKLLHVCPTALSSILCTMQFSGSNRDNIFKSPCTNIEDCEARRDCIMKHLYERLFCWLVNAINFQIFQGLTEEHINLLDLYGFEVFDHNTFEQLCINYANERLQHYFTKSYLMQQRDVLLEEGFQVDAIEDVDYVDRIALIDGPISIFGILNEECAMKRFKSNLYLNTRLGQTFRNNKHFFINDELETFFSIRHYAGVVKYDTTTMINKNMDKIPTDIIAFLKCSNYAFLRTLLENDNENLGNHKRTVLNYFKKSFDKLINNFDKCDVHYIKCLKPNNYKIADFFDEDYFTKQLMCNGIFEILKLSFQKYPIKMNIDIFTKKIGYNLHEILKKPLGNELHIGKRSIFMSEACLCTLEKFKLIKMHQSARAIQRYWNKYMKRKHKAACIIQNYCRRYLLLKKDSTISRFTDLTRVLSQLPWETDDVKNDNTNRKVEEYLRRNLVELNHDGLPLSLQLEKTYNQLTLKKFKRIQYFGDRIVSFCKLAEIPIRFHIRKTCIRYSHLLPNSELSKGLMDIY